MEKPLSFVLRPSLEQMALRRIAIALHDEPVILTSIAKLKHWTGCFQPNVWDDEHLVDFKNLKILCRTVKDKMLKLQLPESLTKQMMLVLPVIASEIFTWKSIHEKYLSTSISRQSACLQKLRWTSAGTVDYRKTAEELVRCDVMNIAKRFEIACWYCLEDHLEDVWEELTNGDKSTFCKTRAKPTHLLIFLPNILDKQCRIRYSFAFAASNSFEKSALCGNKTLADYYFQKLTKEKREASLVRTARYLLSCQESKDKVSDVIHYLLSLMTPEQQIEIIKEKPCHVLWFSLDWPWQDLSIDIADVIWTFLPEDRYNEIWRVLYRRIKYSGYYFPNCVQNLFLRSPVESRKCFVYFESMTGEFLWFFFENEDTDTIEVIFRNIDVADRMKLVSSLHGLLYLCDMSYKWHVKEAFLRAATLSKEDKEILKASFISFAKGREQKYDSIELLREEHRKFFEFVEETDSKAGNKRSLEDETLTKSKKINCEKGEKSTQ